MRRLIILAALLFPYAAAAQESLTLSGVLRAGEPGEIPYQVIAPARWNGTFVVDLDFTTSWNPALRQWFLDEGYAIGGTRRLQNSHAYVIREYVENFLTLRRLLTERSGTAPKRTIAFGVSRGAIPARAAIEMHPDVFDGAVVFSGGGQALVGLLNTKLDVSWTLKDVDYQRLFERSSLRELVRQQYRKAGLDLDADLERLARAPRIAADPAAVAVAERHVGYTGRIKGPILSVKTVGDPADPPATDTAYSETLRRAGTRDLLRNVYINRPGHATMTVGERIAGFQALIDRLASGRWADEAELPAALNALTERLDRDSPLELGPPAFVRFTAPQALRTWDFSNWGTYKPPR